MKCFDNLIQQFFSELGKQNNLDAKIKEYKHIFQFLNIIIPEMDSLSFNELTGKINKIRDCLRRFAEWIDKSPNQSIISENNNDVGNGKTQQSAGKLQTLLFIYKNQQLYSRTDEQVKKIENVDLLVNQLCRRYKSFCDHRDPEFFSGIADYIKFVFDNGTLSKLVSKYIINVTRAKLDNFEEEFQNSVWGAFLELMLVHVFFYGNGNIRKLLNGNRSVETCFDLYQNEMNEIMRGDNRSEKIYIKRHEFNTNMMRVHNRLLEVLESNCFQNSNNENIVYNFNPYGIPTGELIMTGFDPVIFFKMPATVLRFFFLNKSNGRYFSYKDFNQFVTPAGKQLNSNSFRLLINSVNDRVEKMTQGVVKELIVKREKLVGKNAQNCYRWNERK